MRKIKSNFKCRLCNSSNIAKINLSLPRAISPFLSREKTWKNFYCPRCNSISHFLKKKKNLIKYSDSSYRKSSNFQADRPSSPISLPWSTITSLRSSHISKLIEKFNISDKFNCKNINLLDYGGYNGFTSYGLKSFFNIEDITVADLDPNGLKIASSLGMKAVNLHKSVLSKNIKNKFDLCISVHVFEHLKKPEVALGEIHKCLKDNGILYVEVPNLFGSFLTDPAHLLSFSKEGLKNLISNNGFKIIKIGFIRTPKEAIKYGYPYSNWRECIYCIAKKETYLNLMRKKSKKGKILKPKEIIYSKKKFLAKLAVSNFFFTLTYPYNLLNFILNLLKRFIIEIIRSFLSLSSSLFFLFINLFKND
tara:strand:- start:268 stop:1359 length:1092 start_codon:yes stop_codon:yes gene_type:complete